MVREQLRLADGRDAEPSAGLIDSQSVKGADTVGRETRGYDAGKKINGRKRFIVTDTLGLLLIVMVCTASRQDRDGAKTILLATYPTTRMRFLFADAGAALANAPEDAAARQALADAGFAGRLLVPASSARQIIPLASAGLVRNSMSSGTPASAQRWSSSVQDFGK